MGHRPRYKALHDLDLWLHLVQRERGEVEIEQAAAGPTGAFRIGMSGEFGKRAELSCPNCALQGADGRWVPAVTLAAVSQLILPSDIHTAATPLRGSILDTS